MRERIRTTASTNLFRDAANIAIIEVREQIKEKWVETFDGISGFDTRENSLRKLRAMTEFGSKSRSVSQTLRRDRLCNRFERIVDELSGGHYPLEFGTGVWLEMLRGKFILPSVISHCFRVVDA